MTRSFRPFTPPWALTCFAHASAAMEMDPQAAAGPESGALIPRTTSESVTPGACAKAADAESNTASPASAFRRIGSSPVLQMANLYTPRDPARNRSARDRPRGPTLLWAALHDGERHSERRDIQHR